MREPLALVGSNVRPWSLRIFAACVNAWHEMNIPGNPPLFVTCGREGEHMPGSLHGSDRALDIRTKTLPTHTMKIEFRDRVRKRLGHDFDVILEDAGGPNEHLHVERDMRAGA